MDAYVQQWTSVGRMGTLDAANATETRLPEILSDNKSQTPLRIEPKLLEDLASCIIFSLITLFGSDNAFFLLYRHILRTQNVTRIPIPRYKKPDCAAGLFVYSKLSEFCCVRRIRIAWQADRSGPGDQPTLLRRRRCDVTQDTPYILCYQAADRARNTMPCPLR